MNAGLCQCGCGEEAPIAKKTRRAQGHIKGLPQRFKPNHYRGEGRPALTASQVVAQGVVPGAPNECWPWRGTRASNGYGVTSLGGRQYKAHRVVYEAAKGPIPEGLLVRHTCDNPPCCNPSHLLVGTIDDNADDRVERNRQARGVRIPQARLTPSDVIAARRRHATGETVAAIARDFGMSHSQMRRVVLGESWKHVLGEAA